MSLSGKATTSRDKSGVRWTLVAPFSAFKVEAADL